MLVHVRVHMERSLGAHTIPGNHNASQNETDNVEKAYQIQKIAY